MSVMGPTDSRMPMPQQSWSIIQRPRTGWRLSKTAVGGEGLIDLLAVGRGRRWSDGGVVADDGDVGAFAGHEGLADVVAHGCRGESKWASRRSSWLG